MQSGTEHKYGGDDDRGLTTEARERVIGFQEACDIEREDNKDRDHVVAKLFGKEQANGDDEDREERELLRGKAAEQHSFSDHETCPPNASGGHRAALCRLRAAPGVVWRTICGGVSIVANV